MMHFIFNMNDLLIVLRVGLESKSHARSVTISPSSLFSPREDQDKYLTHILLKNGRSVSLILFLETFVNHYSLLFSVTLSPWLMVEISDEVFSH